MIPAEYIGPYGGSNVFSLALLVLAIKWPRPTRYLFVLVFVAAGMFNTYTALTQPELYLNYAELAVLDIYRKFIDGLFSDYTQTFVLLIAAGQLTVGACLLGSGNLLSLGVAGGIVFFVAICPLGLGSAFPMPLVLAIALLVMKRRLQKQLPPSIETGEDIYDDRTRRKTQ